nr:RcnB family protein [Mesorhizobium sp.]
MRRPDRGQEWIRVGNDYLLIGVVSGIIFGAIATH